MKRVIRKGTFETNSSSMHSLVITKKEKIVSQKLLEEDLYISKDGKINIWNEDDLYFDRAPFRMLTQPLEKLEYLIASNADNLKEVKRLIDLFKKIYPKVKEIEFPSDYGGGSPCYGGVDHQSNGFVTSFIKENGISEEDFIKNNKYIIIIDGDEYCEWEKVKKSGLIDMDNILIDVNVYDYETEQNLDEEIEER